MNRNDALNQNDPYRPGASTETLHKIGNSEAFFLKEIPPEIKRLSYPLLRKYLENKMLQLCKAVIKLEKEEFGGGIELYTDYFKEKENDYSALPYINFAATDRKTRGSVMVCEDTEFGDEIKFPGGYFAEIRVETDFPEALDHAMRDDMELRVYLERKRTKKVKIVNLKLDRKINTIRKILDEKTLGKTQSYAKLLKAHVEGLSAEDVALFEKNQAGFIEKEIRNMLHMQKEMGTDFKGKSLAEMSDIFKSSR